MPKRKAQYFIREQIDRPVTKKEFFRLRDAEVKRTHISQQDLITQNQYSKHQLDTYIKEGLLKPIKHKGQKYFPKDQLIALIESEPSQRKMPF